MLFPQGIDDFQTEDIAAGQNQCGIFLRIRGQFSGNITDIFTFVEA